MTAVLREPARHSESLVLGEGRYRVEARWRTSDGKTGRGTGIPLTRDSGYFWFFHPDNVEIALKILDGCHLEGFESRWVYGAGLTDVEVELVVDDLLTGESKIYENPIGGAFRAIRDTRAFPSCP